jgi:UDP-N-acetylmuramoyl-tripeptide--D-alanyl-D-alanine ligase
MTAVMDSLAHFAQVSGGRLCGPDTDFVGVTTDTRKLQPRELYVALRGDRYDGHDYVAQAGELGAAAAVVERETGSDLPQVVVADALAALQRYAAHWRSRFSIPVVGVTGSNGKTTTKEMLASIFGHRGPVLATIGNLNNHIGVPLTLVRLRATHQAAIIEMGANHAGEIALLAEIARPTIGLVTQAGAAHLEGFGSIEGVAKAKGEMFAGLGSDGLAVINADDAYAGLWRQLAAHRRQLSFGLQADADVTAKNVRETVEADGARIEFELVTPAGSTQAVLPMAGLHNLMNALGAAACAIGAGVTLEAVASGLASMRDVAGRLVRRAAVNGAQLIDDTYNANPTSLEAALGVMRAMPGRRWLALGDMGELGDEAASLHRQAGLWARAHGIERLYAVGPHSRGAADSFGEGGRHFPDHGQLAAALEQDLAAGVTVLIKGSRSMQMERVVAALLASGPARTGLKEG